MRSERSSTSSIYHSEKIPLAKFQTIYADRFKAKLSEKGLSTFLNLRKEFRILDENGNGSLSFQEFFSVIKKFKIDIPDVDIKNAFKAFDLNRNGEIEYDEFVKVLIGPMNQIRLSYVEKAFDRLDIH
jgi:Ca2+-binding EF-hand superfamily protein